MAIDYQYYEFQSYEYLVRLGQLWEGMEELTGVQELLAQIRKEQELIRTRKFRVAVVGEFRRGKSTFVNALLGREILPTDALPTTATLNRITYGAVPKAYLCYRDGRREDVRIEELSRYVTKLTRESENAAAQIEEAVVEYPSIFCQNHVDLIDTPGMNDDMAMNDVTLSQLEHIDLAVVTLSPGSPFSETESRFMAKLLESEEICQIIVVVTKIDEIRGEEQRKKFLAYLSSQIPEKTYARLQETHGENEPVFEKFRRILKEPILFGVCSLDALEARQYGDEELLERSGFAGLNSRLPQIILASQNNNTVLRAVHTVRKIAEDYEKWLPALRAECEDRKEVAGLASFLAGIGQAPRIQNRDILILLQIRTVGMTEHNQVEAAGTGILLQHLRPHGNIVVMSMRNQHMIVSDAELVLFWQLGKEIIVSCHNMNRTVRQPANVILASLRVPAVNQHIDGP